MQLSDFKNEALSDLKGNPEHLRRMQEALEQVSKELGREYDVVIRGERVKTAEKLSSYNPAKKDQVVGVISKANEGLADHARLAQNSVIRTPPMARPIGEGGRVEARKRRRRARSRVPRGRRRKHSCVHTRLRASVPV